MSHRKKLYNRNLFWCDSFDGIASVKIFEKSQHGITYSRHYSNAICDRRILDYAKIETLLSGMVVEVEFCDGEMDKALIRNEFNDRLDITTVVRFTQDGLLFVTAWLNQKNNNHDQLDAEKYELKI